MKNVLIIAAHPDDEILGCGGLMAKLSSQRVKVSVALLTGGIRSRYTKTNAKMDRELTLIRKHALAANKLVGVKEKDVHFLGYEDQKLDTVPLLDLTKSLKDLVSAIRPQDVYTHNPGDYNKDHRVCYEATLVATRVSPGEFSPEKLFCYEVLSSTERSFGSLGGFKPNTYVDIRNQVKRKQKAMAAYKTELRKYPHPRSVEGVRILAELRGIEVGLQFAEAFHLVRSLG